MDVEQRKNCLRVKVIKKYLDEENKAPWKRTNKYDVIKNAIPQEWIKRIETMEEGKQEKDV